LSARAKLGSKKRFKAALSKVPNREPEPNDRLGAPANKPLQRTALSRRR
jgi:hypothetical protein